MDETTIFNRIAQDPTILGDILRKLEIVRKDDSIDLDLLSSYMRNDNLKII